MLPGIARALESFFGSSLGAAARALSTAATVGFLACVLLALARAGVWLAARRLGWETVQVVRCPRCLRVVADPGQSTCPQGHPIRFPPGAARLEMRRRRHARWGPVYAIVLSLAVAALATAVYFLLRVGTHPVPVGQILASLAYFFFLAALYAGDFALSPRRRGVGSRLLHAAIALACLTPFLLFAPVSRALEPGEVQVLGYLWSTPAATYLSAGRSSEKIGPAATRARAALIEARVPALDVDWQGIKGFEAVGSSVEWRGAGGWRARLLDRWEEPLRRHGVYLRRVSEEIPLRLNVRVRVLREGGRIRFEEESAEGADGAGREP